MSRYQYHTAGIRLRSVASAWQEEAGECVEGTQVERVVCVEVDQLPFGTQVQRAKAMVEVVMRQLYPKVNAFEIYNTVDEKEDPAAVLGYVTGFGGNRQRYEANPVVAFRTPNPNPEQYREPGAETWEQYFAMEADKAVARATPDDDRVALAFAAEHDDTAGLGGI